MKLEQLLGLVVGSLDEIGIPYMLTGSLASSFHGAPRATQDVDLVVEAEAPALIRLAGKLEAEGLYVSETAIHEAVVSRGLFNAIDPASGWKIDFILRRERDFSRQEFDARQTITFIGLDLAIARAEDMVVAKLEWAKLSDSDRQIRDVVEILRVQGSALDIDSIERWVGELDLGEQWAVARDRARS